MLVEFRNIFKAPAKIYYEEKEKANKLYIEEKRKADKSNWNDIKFSYEEIKENDGLIAFTVKIENCKNDTNYFFVEVQKLIIDDKNIKFMNNDKQQILSWLSGGTNNLQDGVALNPRDKSKAAGLWKLFDINGTKNRIIFREYDKNKGTQSQEKCLCFLNSAKGELKLHGVYVQRSIGTGACGSGRPYYEVIRGDFIFRFRIDIINNKPKMVMFEEGQIEYCSDQEIFEVMIHEK